MITATRLLMVKPSLCIAVLQVIVETLRQHTKALQDVQRVRFASSEQRTRLLELTCGCGCGVLAQEMVWMKTNILEMLREFKENQAAIVRMEPQVVTHGEALSSLTTLATSLRDDVTVKLADLNTVKTTLQVLHCLFHSCCVYCLLHRCQSNFVVCTANSNKASCSLGPQPTGRRTRRTSRSAC